MSFEHIRDVATLCNVLHVTQENIVLRLLGSPFKMNALEWFIRLQKEFILTWDNLGDLVTIFFKEKYDHLSLVEKLTTIERAPREKMTNFNIHF